MLVATAAVKRQLDNLQVLMQHRFFSESGEKVQEVDANFYALDKRLFEGDPLQRALQDFQQRYLPLQELTSAAAASAAAPPTDKQVEREQLMAAYRHLQEMHLVEGGDEDELPVVVWTDE